MSRQIFIERLGLQRPLLDLRLGEARGGQPGGGDTHPRICLLTFLAHHLL